MLRRFTRPPASSPKPVPDLRLGDLELPLDGPLGVLELPLGDLELPLDDPLGDLELLLGDLELLLDPPGIASRALRIASFSLDLAFSSSCCLYAI